MCSPAEPAKCALVHRQKYIRAPVSTTWHVGHVGAGTHICKGVQDKDDARPAASRPEDDNDLVFVVKLIVLSLAGGAVIKWGSLLMDLPFSANPVVAVAIVLGTPAVWAAVYRNK